jgi:hypothetical protein
MGSFLQNRNQFRDLVNMVMNLRLPTSEAAISYSINIVPRVPKCFQVDSMQLACFVFLVYDPSSPFQIILP